MYTLTQFEWELYIKSGSVKICPMYYLISHVLFNFWLCFMFYSVILNVLQIAKIMTMLNIFIHRYSVTISGWPT